MRGLEKLRSSFGTAVVLALALAMGGCETDSPTAPSQGPAPPPSSGGGGGSTSTAWNITVSANPNEIPLEEILEDGSVTVEVTVTARRADNGQPAPVGSTAVLSTTSGTLSDFSGSVTGTSIPITFGAGGRALANLTVDAQQAVNIRLQAQLEGSFGQATVRVLEEAETDPLFIETVVPNSGPPSGGTIVRIEGSGFDEPVRVSFGGLFANVLSITPNRITVETPATNLAVGQVQTVGVTVTINVNDPDEPSQSDTLANAFTYARAGQTDVPSIISLTPTSGPNEGGTLVTINGEGFSDQVQVFFGTAALIEAPVISVTPTQIRVETPAATGPNAVNQNAIVNVRVVNVESGLFAEAASAFQYGGGGAPTMFISAAGPTQGIYLGGTLVNVFGQGFEEPVALEFGGLGQQEISVTGTEIVGRSVPVEIINCNRPSGPFRVTNIETGETAESGVIFTYEPVEPLISGLDPSSVEVDISTREIVGPDRVIIRGAGFDPPVRVIFGGEVTVSGAAVNPNALDPAYDPRFGISTEIIASDGSGGFIVPPFFGDFDTRPCTDASGNEGEQPVPTRVSVEVINLSTDCNDIAEGIFTYVPVTSAGSPAPCVAEAQPQNPPTADFTFGGESGSNTVSFTDLSTSDGTIVSWSWTFGDGGTSAVRNPEHTYASDGTFAVTLTVTDDEGQTSAPASQSVTVPLP